MRYNFEEKMNIIKTVQDVGVVKAAKLYKVSRQAIYCWINSLKYGGDCAPTKKKRNVVHPLQMSIEIERQILELKQSNPEWSANRIKKKLNLKYSVTSINKKIRSAESEKHPGHGKQGNFIFDLILSHRKIKLKNISEEINLVVMELPADKLFCCGYCKENSLQEIALFCDYFFETFKSISFNNAVVLNLSVSNSRWLKLNSALVKILQKYNITISEKNINLPKVYSADFVRYYDLLLNKNNIVNDLHASIVVSFLKEKAVSLADDNHQRMKIINQLLLKVGFMDTSTYISDYDLIKRTNNYWSTFRQTAMSDSFINSMRQLFSMAEILYKQNENKLTKEILDFLIIYINEKNSDELFRKILIQLGILYQRTGNWQDAEENFIKARAIALKNHDSQAIISSNNYLYSLYVQKKDDTKAVKYLHSQVVIAKKSNNVLTLISAYQNLAALNINLYKYKAAFSCYNQILCLVEETGSLFEKARTLGNIGVIFYRKGNYNKARDYFDEAIFLIEREGFLNRLYSIYGNLGLVLEEIGELTDALNCHLKMYEYAKAQNNNSRLAAALANIGTNHMTTGKYGESLSNYNELLNVACLSQNQELLAVAYGNIGIVYYLTNSFFSADKNLKKAIFYAKKIGSYFYLCNFYYYLAEISYHRKQYRKVDGIINEVLNIAGKCERKDILFLANILKEKNHYCLNNCDDKAFNSYLTFLNNQLLLNKNKQFFARLSYEKFKLISSHKKLRNENVAFFDQYKCDTLIILKRQYKKNSYAIYKNWIEEVELFI